jgi:hypothetical protein
MTVTDEMQFGCLWCGHDLPDADHLFCSGMCERMWLTDDKI